MKTSIGERRRIFRLFAGGKTPCQVAEELKDSSDPIPRKTFSISLLEKLFEEYLMLPLPEKLRLTLLPQFVSNRIHRLADDISDLERIDALLPDGEAKVVISLLDIKRKIKERMMKEDLALTGSRSVSEDEDIENEIDRCYEKIFGYPAAEKKVR